VAAELERELAASVKLLRGAGGVFDVVADGRLVYSKHETGRFPEPGEVARLIRGS
jgi:selT/selW/selH-like putative selenoprotein